MIRFVVPFDGWAVDKIAAQFAAHMRGVEVAREASQDASANVYFPYYLMTEKTKWDVALFTHLEDMSKSEDAARKALKFSQVAVDCDVCWAMSKATAKLLPSEKTTILEPPPGPEFMQKPIVLGFSGIPDPLGRKKFEHIARLEKIPGVECYFTAGTVPTQRMPEFYRKIDYLVIVSENEGGPLPVKEALASGTPVFAPNVGWAWEYPVLRYVGINDLEAQVRRMVFMPQMWEDAVRTLHSMCIGGDDGSQYRSGFAAETVARQQP